MSRSQRLFDLLQLLRRHRRPVSGAVLAEALGVSVRTVYRDITSLQALGAEIQGEAGIGYVLKPGFLLPPLMFSDTEIEALALGLKWVGRRTDDDLARAAQDVLAKVSAILPDDLRARLEDDALVVAPGWHRAEPDLSVLRRVLKDERKLKIGYADDKGNRTERIVWPVTLGFFQTVRVLVAWCELRGDFRHFRTDRIQGLNVLEGRPPKCRKDLHMQWRETMLTKADMGTCYTEASSQAGQEETVMSTELRLYTNPQSRGNVVNWMLEEIGEPYEMEILDYGPPMKSPDYLAIHPMGKVPALQHGDVFVTETAAILCYLADVFPEAGLAPAPEHRGDYYRWMFFASGCLEPATSNHAAGWDPVPEMQPRFGYGSYELTLSVLADALKGKQYLVGDRFSAADVLVGAYLGFSMEFDIVEKRPEFTAYCDGLNSRPAALRAQEKIAALMTGQAWENAI